MQQWLGRVLGVALLAGCLGMAAPARAYGERQGGPLTLRAGPVFPVADTRDSVELSLGADLDLRMTSPLRGSQLSLSADWMRITSRRGTRTRNVNVVPVLLNARWAQGAGTGSWYAGGGLGATLASARVPEMDLGSDLNLGWQALGGYHLTPKIRAEVRFLASNNPSKDGVFLVNVGYRL